MYAIREYCWSNFVRRMLWRRGEKFPIGFRPLNGGNDLELEKKRNLFAREAPPGQDAPPFRWRSSRNLPSSWIR